MDVFYDGEIVAIVYRGKSKTTGLVATIVWAWIGSKAILGEKETAKLQDMASRFNTSLVRAPHSFEMSIDSDSDSNTTRKGAL
jgi:hypothetical protein